MKHSQSPIWKKKRLKKFQNARRAKSKVTSVKKPQTVPVAKDLPRKVEPEKKKTALFKSTGQTLSKKSKFEKREQSSGRMRSAFYGWLRVHDSDIQLILFPLILLIILLSLMVYNNKIFIGIAKQEPIIDDQVATLQPYPYVQSVITPTISAQAAIILNKDSQVVLYAKNPDVRFSMASTTKIMTAITALDYYKPNDILTVKTADVPGSGLNLPVGEQFTFLNLMYAMLLPSANDAAQAIADNYPGGDNAFITQMNDKAQSLHLINTHYADPTGLDDDGDYSTVIDMARLASYASSNPIFASITATKYKIIYNVQYTRQYPLTNLNRLLGIDGVTGIKTGTTEGAGQVLVTSTVKNGHTFIIVVMDSVDRFADTSKLLQFIDANVRYITPESPVIN